MKNSIRGPLCLALLAVLSGCGSNVTYLATDPMVLSPKPEGYDVPYSYGSEARAHRVLGELRVTTEIKPSFNETSTFDQSIEQMKAEARKRGADAVFNVKTLDSQAGGAHGKLTLVGTLVIYTSPPEMGAAGGSKSR